MINETLILAPGASNSELLRTLAKNGMNTIGTSIVTAERLAEIALDKSGITIGEAYLTRREAAARVDSFIGELGYYDNVSYADSEALAETLFSLREQIPEEEDKAIYGKLPQGKFQSKNRMLVEAYERYMESMEDKNEIDYIGKLRLAIEKAEPIDANIVLLEEFPVSILERKLAEHLSEGKLTISNLIELSGLKMKPLSQVTITDCYGSSNEVRDVLRYIYDNKIPFDQCTVAVTDAVEYSQLFNEIGLQFNIPMVFGCGLSINVANPARLLKLYIKWSKEGYRGVDGLREMLLSNSFDRAALSEALPNADKFGYKEWSDLAKEAGYLRLSTNKESNKKKVKEYLEYTSALTYRNDKAKKRAEAIAACVEALAKELQEGVGYWIEKYSKIRGSFMKEADNTARTVICNEIKMLSGSKSEEEILDAIQSVWTRMIVRKQSEEGSLLVTGIKEALSAVRPYLFVVGLSSDKYPGTPTENYLMLDSDYRLFGDEENVPSSFTKVKERENNLKDLIRFAAGMESEIRLSFPSFNLAEVKELNPSSALFEVFKEINGEDSLYKDFVGGIRKVDGFFQDKTSKHWRVGISFAEGKDIDASQDACKAGTSPKTTKKTKGIPLANCYSPTAIGTYFSCPMKFYLKYVLNLAEPEEDNPSEIIHANERGNLIHGLMEQNGKLKYTEEDFLKAAEMTLDEFLKSRPPLMPKSAEKERKDFLELAQKAYKQEKPDFKVLLAEERIEFTHSTGIVMGGYPDRVEEYPDGKSAVVDFKSGRSITQKNNDVKSCLQGLLYARGVEEKGIKVSHCEFRYPREGKVIMCEHDSATKKQVDNLLEELKDAFDKAEFKSTPSKAACTHCKYETVCGKKR